MVLRVGISPVQSRKTGRMYFTTKTCAFQSTFDEETCKQIIGQQFPGKIVRIKTDPYDYAIPESGEINELEHRWEFQDSALTHDLANVLEDSEVVKYVQSM